MRIFATQQGNFAPNPQNPRPSPPRTTPPKAVASDAQRKLVDAIIVPPSPQQTLKPERQPRPQNVPGDMYVDSTCIDCDACRWMVPDVFARVDGASAVVAQPSTPEARTAALQAVLTCPTFSIHVVHPTDGELAAARDTFPRPLYPTAPSVYHLGHHDEASYSATPYLITRAAGNVMVDVPRYTPALATAIERMGGVRYIYLTHQDDVGDHAKWAARFGAQRILHEADVRTRQGTHLVERKLQGSGPWPLDDTSTDITIYHVPGHSSGSTALHYTPEACLFTGDSLAFSAGAGSRLSMFPRYCYDFVQQAHSVAALLELEDFVHLLPGHGRSFVFENEEEKRGMFARMYEAEGVAHVLEGK